MLLSLAETQVDEHKFMAGRYSFKSAVADFGLSGFLINKNSGQNLEHPKPKYRIDEGQDEENMLPRAYMGHKANNLGSDRYVEDGDFIRLNNLSFRYSLNPQIIKKIRFNIHEKGYPQMA